MKKLILIFLISASVSAGADQVHKTGVGFILGSPTALTGKHWLDSRSAVDAGLSFGINDYFLIYGDYLFHFPELFGKSNSQFVEDLIPYAGVGGIFAVGTKEQSTRSGYFGKNRGEAGLGARFPVGVEWLPKNTPVGIYLELALGLSILPETSGFAQGGLGARFYF
jgi:hypothetical protein